MSIPAARKLLRFQPPGKPRGPNTAQTRAQLPPGKAASPARQVRRPGSPGSELMEAARVELTACPGEGLPPGARWTQGLPKQWPRGILRKSGTRTLQGWCGVGGGGWLSWRVRRPALQSGKARRRGPVAAAPPALTWFLICRCIRSLFTWRASNAAFCMALCNGDPGRRVPGASRSQGPGPGTNTQCAQNPSEKTSLSQRERNCSAHLFTF